MQEEAGQGRILAGGERRYNLKIIIIIIIITTVRSSDLTYRTHLK
jgi:hypothetical protein